MNKQELHELVADAVNDAELKASDIPAIDLYVDQIINLVSTRLESGSERYRDRVLTKTMINNYSKDRIIMPVKGKKYNKEQITQMLSVYSLKNTLSIGEIKRLLWGIYSVDGFEEKDLVELYDAHQDIKQDNRELAEEILGELVEKNSLNIEDGKDYALTVCALVSLSAHLKSIAQSMIEQRYPEPVYESENKEKAKDKSKDKPKEKTKEKKPKKQKAKKAEE